MQYVKLDFDDPLMAQAIADATPPEGVKVSGPSTLIQASDAARILEQIVIEFVPQFSATVLAGWILLALQNRSNKSTRINCKEVDLEHSNILRLIENQLANQKAREAQREAEHKEDWKESAPPNPQ
jgi:hypothetical protein